MNKNTTKLDLCNQIAHKLGKPASDVKSVIEVFLDEILNNLSKDNRIEIRGFGAFSVKRRNKRTGRNPRTGEAVDIPSHTAPYFKFSKEAQNIFDIKRAIKKP